MPFFVRSELFRSICGEFFTCIVDFTLIVAVAKYNGVIRFLGCYYFEIPCDRGRVLIAVMISFDVLESLLPKHVLCFNCLRITILLLFYFVSFFLLFYGKFVV